MRKRGEPGRIIIVENDLAPAFPDLLPGVCKQFGHFLSSELKESHDVLALAYGIAPPERICRPLLRGRRSKPELWGKQITEISIQLGRTPQE